MKAVFWMLAAGALASAALAVSVGKAEDNSLLDADKDGSGQVNPATDGEALR
ncbi:MAG: hypothetical protein AB7E05_12920 [Sphingobium sp.]